MANLLSKNLDYLKATYPPLLVAIQSTDAYAAYQINERDQIDSVDQENHIVMLNTIEDTLNVQLNKGTQRVLLPRVNSNLSLEPITILAESIDASKSFLLDSLPNIHSDQYDPEKCSNYFAKDVIMMGSLGLSGIEKIISKVRINNLLVVDDNYDSFFELLKIVDFEGIISACKANGISLHFVIERDFDRIIEMVKYELACNMFVALFGLNIIMSPPASALLEAVVQWLKSPQGLAEFFKGMMGQETDEVNQSLHAIYNSKSHLNRKILNFNEKEIENVVVVASGPSLDTSIEDLRSISNDVTIISAGSAIGALLRNGIKFKYAVLLEMSSDVFRDMCQLIAEGFDLSSITLIASITIDPRIASLFGKFITFQRPVSTTAVFFEKEEDSTLPYAGPQAVNAAFEVSWAMNPKSITLLGCDLSSPDNKRLRSSNAVGLSPRDFDIPMFGTNNRTVFTDSGLLMTKEALEATIELTRCPVYRVGEGLPINSSKIKQFGSLSSLINAKLLIYNKTMTQSVDHSFSKKIDISSEDIEALRSLISDSLLDFQRFISDSLELLRSENTWSLKVSNYFSRALSMADRDTPRKSKIYRRMLRLPLFFSLQPLHDCPDENLFDDLINHYECSLSLMYKVYALHVSVVDKVLAMNSLPPYDPKFIKLMIDKS